MGPATQSAPATATVRPANVSGPGPRRGRRATHKNGPDADTAIGLEDQAAEEPSHRDAGTASLDVDTPTELSAELDPPHEDPEIARRAEFARATSGLVLPKGYTLPAGYEVSPAGVKDPRGTQVASAPLLPVCVYIDPDGHEAVEIVWRGRAGWVSRVVPRSEISSGKALVASQADSGLPVIASDAAKAERWLSLVETHNRKVIPVVILARWLGWQPDGAFVCGPDDGRRVEPAWPAYQALPLAAHSASGAFAGWRAAVELLRDFPLAVMVVSASFAAPLLEPLGLNSFMLDICGRSTRGKTTSGKVAASVWGEPTDTGTIYSWQTTIMPAEQRLNLVRGLPVVFDETQLQKSPDVIHKILYSLDKGRGQDRGKGWPSGLRFQTILISTGERSALTFTHAQGAAARALTMSSPPLPGGEGHGAIAAAVAEGTEANYGHAGPAFAGLLVAMLKRPSGRVELRNAHASIRDELMAGLAPDADIARRRAPYLAVLILAARLAHDWGVMPVAAPPLSEWTKTFQAEQETDNRAEMALDVLREYLGGHPNVLWPGHGGRNNEPRDGWVGRWVDVDGVKAVAVLPERLRAILREANYDLEDVRPLWRDQGVLIGTTETDRVRDTREYRMAGGGKARLFVFGPKHLDLSATDDDA